MQGTGQLGPNPFVVSQTSRLGCISHCIEAVHFLFDSPGFWEKTPCKRGNKTIFPRRTGYKQIGMHIKPAKKKLRKKDHHRNHPGYLVPKIEMLNLFGFNLVVVKSTVPQRNCFGKNPQAGGSLTLQKIDELLNKARNH